MFVEHDRRSIRLPGYDYASIGAYFVTICAYERGHIFGDIKSGDMHLNGVGEMVADEWIETAAIRPYVQLDEWIVMPNHFHAIVWITGVDLRRGKARLAPTPTNVSMEFGKPPPRSIPSIIGSFKSAATKRIHESRRMLGPIWQRNYYERVIRDERELFAVRNYIRNNPANWERDEYK